MITINHLTFEIFVSKDETTYISTNPITGYEERELWINDFRLKLSALLDDEENMLLDDIYEHKTESVVSGILLAKVILFLAPYTFTFEDGFYSVQLRGVNTNLLDVKNPNSVSLIPNNSAGLIGEETAEDVDAPVWDTTIGITNAFQNVDNINITWGSASDKNEVRYNIYISRFNTDVFNKANLLTASQGHLLSIDADTSEPLQDGITYYIGVRAVDIAGNETDNINYASIIFSSTTIADQVWNHQKARDVLSVIIGNLDIVDNKIIYVEDGNIVDFDLFDKDGVPTMASVFKRTKVEV